mmetsp:Transcript_119503/g.168093  ORF Transcript_119503/g.168093 Transcript_119503/m.168093 type:complete len:93 (-) Transcript_119503:65-343(-)
MAVILVQSVGTLHRSAIPVRMEELGAEPTVTKVKALKEMVCQHTSITPIKQRMEYKGRVLKDDMTLAECGLSEGGRIFLEAHCDGGPGWFWH